MAHPTPIKVLLTTTLQPLAMDLSGSLAHGVKLIDQFLHHKSRPETMAQFERQLCELLREVGRRISALRKEKRLTLEALSSGTGLNVSFLS